jgi:hypothetical protein
MPLGKRVGLRTAAIAAAALFVIAYALVSVSYGGGGDHRTYSVAFVSSTQNYTKAQGWTAYGTSTDDSFPLVTENVSAIHFVVAWSDESAAPFPDPAVTFESTGPNASGGSQGSVAPSGTTFDIVLRAAPKGGQVEAASPEEAAAVASRGINATIGQGQWNWSLIVSDPAFGALRPRGTVSWTLFVTVDVFEMRVDPTVVA